MLISEIDSTAQKVGTLLDQTGVRLSQLRYMLGGGAFLGNWREKLLPFNFFMTVSPFKTILKK